MFSELTTWHFSSNVVEISNTSILRQCLLIKSVPVSRSGFPFRLYVSQSLHFHFITMFIYCVMNRLKPSPSILTLYKSKSIFFTPMQRTVLFPSNKTICSSDLPPSHQRLDIFQVLTIWHVDSILPHTATNSSALCTNENWSHVRKLFSLRIENCLVQQYIQSLRFFLPLYSSLFTLLSFIILERSSVVGNLLCLSFCVKASNWTPNHINTGLFLDSHGLGHTKDVDDPCTVFFYSV